MAQFKTVYKNEEGEVVDTRNYSVKERTDKTNTKANEDEITNSWT